MLRFKITLIFFIVTFNSVFSQILKLDSLDNFISKHYYKNLSDKTPLLNRDYLYNYYGYFHIINFIKQETIFRDLNNAIENKDSCSRLELINQKHLNYCEGIEELSNLEYLNLSSVQTEEKGNFIRELPWGVYNLTKLKILIAEDSNLKNISYLIRNLKDLEYLSLSSGKLTEIPKEIGYLKNLVALDISGNQIKSLPETFKNLNRLKYLDLSYNPIQYSISEELSFLNSLEFLSINLSYEYSDLEKIIKVLSELPNLKVLHLRYSNLKMIPKEICNFNVLEQLSLRGNFDLDLSNTFHLLSKVKLLKTLDLSFTKLKKVPKEIGELENIETLYLGNWRECSYPIINWSDQPPYNEIKKLPKEVKNMKSLKKLYLWTWNISDKQKRKICEVLPNTHIEFECIDPYLDNKTNEN